MGVAALLCVLVAVQQASSFRVNNDEPFSLTKRSGPATCNANGDPHFKTFDGKYFNFMGACRYVHVTDACDYSGRPKLPTFKVTAENVNCGRSVSCIRSAKVYIRGETIHLTRGTTSPAPLDKPHYSVQVEGSYVVVRTKPAGLTVKWDRSMVLDITLDDQYRGKVCGLCGNFDGNANDDFRKSDGQITSDVNAFGTSWQAGGKCGQPVTPTHPCERHPDRHVEAEKDCSVIKSNDFASCRGALDLDKLYDNCVYDSCAGTTGTMNEPSCESLKQASMMCKDATGKAVSWGHMKDKCRCQRKAYIDNKQECCIFPFSSSGVTFYDCVPQVTSGRKDWCSSAEIASWRTVGECI